MHVHAHAHFTNFITKSHVTLYYKYMLLLPVTTAFIIDIKYK